MGVGLVKLCQVPELRPVAGSRAVSDLKLCRVPDGCMGVDLVKLCQLRSCDRWQVPGLFPDRVFSGF